jgi:hypothetical protein
MVDIHDTWNKRRWRICVCGIPLDKVIDVIGDYESVVLSGESDELLTTVQACGPA